MRATWSFAVGAFAIVAASGWAWATQGPPAAAPFGEEIDVRVINVEAVVTGAKGARVHGLSAADFKLTVDGLEVPIEYFTEVADGVATASRSDFAQGAPGVSPGERMARNYLVYIDELFSVASVRNAVLKNLANDLPLLQGSDRMAILAFNGVKTDVLSGWTSDHDALLAALEEARRRSTGGNQQLAHQRKLERDVQWILDNSSSLDDGDGGDVVAAILEPMSHRISPEARTQLGKTAPAMAAALRGFEAPPGRRMMLLLTGAWSMSVAGNLYSPLLQAADLLGYTLYPVDLAKSPAEDVTAFDSLARATGGRAAVSTKLAVLEVVEEDTRSYYWIGFSPSGKADDLRHRVSLEMRRPDLKVRSRSSFSDLSRHAEASMKAEGILLFGGAPSDRRLRVALGDPRRISRTEIEVPVTLEVPLESLIVKPDGAGYLAETQLAIAIVDEKNRRADLPGSHLQVTLPQSPAAGTYARFRTVIRLRDVAQRLVFTVSNPGNNKATWGEVGFKRSGEQKADRR